MKQLFSIYFVLFFCISLSAQTYSLIYSDEFDGASLDLAKWNIQSGYASNQEKEYYTDGEKNIRFEAGNLVLIARKEQAVTDRNYTSARINTKGKGFIKYGKVEARISVPSGLGTWPAFWMMPEVNVYGTWPYSGEIDIMEHIGSDPRMTSHAVHTANKNGLKGTNWFNKQYKDNMENNFHVYSIIWSPDDIKFYIDDVKSVTLYRNFSEDYKGWPFDQNFYVILNLAIGGTMGGTIDDAIFNNPVEMKVDYVRIYQLNTAVGEFKENNISAYPTKFTDEITVKTDIPTEVKLYNSLGRLVYEKKIFEDEKINTRSFLKGIYLLKTNNSTTKLIK
ncbi:MAG: family 16 glycosylhydrolase [Bacteroidales bacterium]